MSNCVSPVLSYGELHYGYEYQRIVGAISAGRVFFFLVSVMHIDGIAANAGIYLAVTQDRDIEPVMRVGPDMKSEVLFPPR